MNITEGREGRDAAMSNDARPLQVVGHATPSEGRPAQWESVYRETVVHVYRFVYARVGNRADAEDLTTQVYLRALPRLRLPASIMEVRSYLFATARTVLADHWRGHYDAHLAVLGDDVPAVIDTRKPEDEEAGVRRANEVLERLPGNYRQVLELRFLRGYSIRETAAELGITVSNAKVLQFRALRRAAEDAGEADR
jgi:RNA polymerase sigma factor (sigma-70 family)